MPENATSTACSSICFEAADGFLFEDQLAQYKFGGHCGLDENAFLLENPKRPQPARSPLSIFLILVGSDVS